jgi:hypothetical protein
MSLILSGTDGITQAGEFNSDSSFGFKNRIINGAMVIDQRNNGASVTVNGFGYTLDRYFANASETGKYTVQRNAGSVTPPVGFINYYGVTSSSAYSVTSGDYFGFAQPIEGLNVSDLAWGTANAQTVTVSFWVRSSLTGTFGGALQNGASNRSYPFSYTISAANTWEQKSVTIAGDTTGTWLTTNGTGILVWFNLGTGSTRSTTANAWSAGEFLAPTGATSVVGTDGATFYITGVQLEKGSTATSFDYRPFGTELALCQRYFVQYQGDNGTYAGIAGYAVNGTDAFLSMGLPVAMRTSPTGALNGTARFVSGSFDSANFTALSATSTMQTPFNSVSFTVTTSGMTANAGGTWQFRASGSKLTFSAEL